MLKQHPYTGRILFQGRDIAKMKPKELYRHIGIVFQNPANQFVTQNVEDEVCVGLRLWEPGLSDEACRQRAEELLDRYGLKRQRRYSPYMLSQGQQPAGWRFFRCWQAGRNCYCWTNPPTARMPAR